MERSWQFKVEVMRVQWSPDEENTELTHGIQELHAFVCASLYALYESFVLHNQPGYDSPHNNYQQLKLPLQSWTEEEVINGEAEIFFLTMLYDDLLESQLLPVLHRMGMDRRVPIVNYLLDDIETWLHAYLPGPKIFNVS